MFLAASLESLQLFARGDSSLFLSTFGAQCANLTEFSIFTTDCASISTAFNSFLSHLTRIKSIDVDATSCRSFGNLSTLTTLQTLIVRKNSRNKFELRDQMQFPSLVDLELHFFSFKTIGRMLNSMSTPQLNSIDLDSVSYSKAHVIRAFFDRLQKRVPVNQWHAITIDTDAETVPIDFTPDDTITLHTFQPLLSFANLAHANIQLNAGFQLSDECVARIAEAWPLIETLRLTLPYEAKRAVASSITIAGLQAFARHCPLLQSLGLTLDGTIQPPKFKSTVAVAHQELLRFIDVGVSILSSPEDAAEFLSTVFPSLSKIETYWESYNYIQDEFDSATAWNTVQSHLRLGIKVRTRERNWGRLHGSSLPPIDDGSD
ncbi:hypothetical protein B0H16DRAFT_1714046 [Mycena metata]|uniref:F-box domain-containing protein n=1 Tax=Mycena metata TaxID=1033252 RepID=A0AAD7JYF5_9AGAR|nr:hypothetical protein B0H16DRAFT_1714046 [Mycena metata]